MGVLGFEQVGLARGYAAEGVGRTGAGDGALVAMHAAVVADLQEQRTVAEAVAALDAFGATDAKILVDRVFVIRIFDEGAFDGDGRAKLIFGGSGEGVGLGFEVAGAEIAVAAHGVSVDAFHGGLFEHAIGRTVAATNALLRVNLPDPFLGLGATRQNSAERAEAGHRGEPRSAA